jgi:hypothetical protein
MLALQLSARAKKTPPASAATRGSPARLSGRTTEKNNNKQKMTGKRRLCNGKMCTVF